MKEQFVRSSMVLGDVAIEKLQKAHVIIFGIGGVGGYTFEALVRAGVGEITIVDNDTVNESNLNRQIIALRSTIGRMKIDVAEERAKDINPDVIIHKVNAFVLPENINQFDFSKYDFVVDCIDTVSAKIAIVESLIKNGIGIENYITCLGTGNKLNPMGFKIAPIEKTSVCPLARVMRRELKERGIKGVKCVYSEEIPVLVEGQSVPGSVSFVPPAAGLLIASEVVKRIITN